MLKKLNSLWLLALVIAGTSCSNTATNSRSDGDSTAVSATMTKDTSAAEAAVVYEGTLPCADCSGIQTTITLNEDSSYSLAQEYMGKSKNNKFTKEGDWTLNPETKVVTLEGIKNASNQYKVTDTALIMLDREGHEVEGALANHYILRKNK